MRCIKSPNLPRIGDADGVAQADFIDAGVEKRVDQAVRHGRVDLALVGAAEYRRDVAAHHEALTLGGGDDLRQHPKGLRDRFVDVLLRVRLGCAQEDRDLFETGGERALEAALVRDERAVADARMTDGVGGNDGVVSHLRDPARRYEARELDSAKARIDKHLGQLELL